MPTATGHQTLADLEAALLDRQRERYRRLQERVATDRFTAAHGRAPESLAELERGLRSGTVATIDPARTLSPTEIRKALTATG